MKLDLRWALRTFGGVAAIATATSIFPACVAGGDSVTGDDEGESAEEIKTTRIIARAQQWVDAKLPYCQSANHVADPDDACASVCNRENNKHWDAYRSDCSGFVTWAWGLPPILTGGRTTQMYAPYQTDVSHVIKVKDLQPGDALNRITSDPSHGHIILFKNWIEQGKTARFMEEPGCSSSTPYAHEFTSHISIDGHDKTKVHVDYDGYDFHSIRYDDAEVPAPPDDRTEPPPPPPPPAAPPDGIEYAFQANTTSLWTTGSAGTKDWGLGMAAGTSPAIAVEGAHYQVAFQANTGNLWLARGDGHAEDLHLGMAGGTSPAICALEGGGYVIAFQANTGSLWITGSKGTGDQKLGMMAGTSPSIACLPGGGWEVAFQANTSSLWTHGTADTRDWELGLDSHSSPSIAGFSKSDYVVAFQANTHNLWVVTDKHGGGDQLLGMYAGTSPSIVALANGGWEVAFQANTTSLWMHGTAGTFDRQYGMMPGSSPAIIRAGGGFDVAFEANTANLWIVGQSGGGGDQKLGMLSGTSPAGN